MSDAISIAARPHSVLGIVAALSFLCLTGIAEAKQVDITISQDTFKSRCREMGGTYTDHGGGKATCRLPNGQWATCDFLLNYCDTSRIAPPFVAQAGADRVGDSPPPTSIPGENNPSTIDPGGTGKSDHAGGAGSGAATMDGGAGGGIK